MNVKVLQVNLGRSRIAHDILFAIMCDRKIDVAIISEPNVKISLQNRFIMDNMKNVAIYIRNKNVGICSHSVGNGYVCIKWDNWCMYGCYFSPNISLEEFVMRLNSLTQDIKATNLNAIIAGDFNAKAPSWGSPTLDIRGEHLLECAAELNLNVINTGNKPSFERGETKSYIDITLATQNMTSRIRNWEVLDEEVNTYHNYIYFEVDLNKDIRRNLNGIYRILNKEKLVQRINLFFPDKNENVEPEKFITAVGKINKECTMSVPKGARQMPYWWDSDIENKRRECNGLRRKWTRDNRRLGEKSMSSDESLAYKRAKKELKHLILNAKRKQWKKLQSDLESDIWGEGYKIVMRHFGSLPPPYNPSLERWVEIVQELFPEKKYSQRQARYEVQDVVPFTMGELTYAVAKMRMGRSPGPDHITTEVVKILSDLIPKILLSVFNRLLEQQVFPSQWKQAVVVLLWKGKQMDHASAFRPICLLSVLGKLYERLIKERLEEELNRKNGLSSMQFGFVKNKSTVHAIREIVSRVRFSRKKWVGMVCLDIKNAFNSAPWDKLINVMIERDIQKYLVNIIDSYLGDRCIIVNARKKMKVTGGVPQGSVLGPTLWNILYDGVLRLHLMEGCNTVAYADDLALIVEADNSRDLMFKVNDSLDKIVAWMEHHDLQIAPSKSEAVILRGPRRREEMHFKILGYRIAPGPELKYLGVIMDDRLSFGAHVKYVIEKAEARLSNMLRILPNVGGPSNKKRELLYATIQSQILYAIPAWSTVLEIQKHKDKLEKLQRRILLRVVSGYRTIGTSAVQVIAGVPPISLLAEEQVRLFRQRETQLAHKTRQRGITLEKWQKNWKHRTASAAWTKRLIPEVVPWVQCRHRQIDYYMTQFLSGHGHFRTYLRRFHLVEEDSCLYCGASDTTEHAVFVCNRWNIDRDELEKEIKRKIDADSVVKVMLENEINWMAIKRYITKILSARELEERERKKQRNEGAIL